MTQDAIEADIAKNKNPECCCIRDFLCEETRKRCVSVGKNAKKVRKVGKLALNSYVKSREVNPKALSFF